ncbi:anaphase promoting complex subunit 8 [Elsinoe ampelina]|uniref:Anaphase promoting complex subunit 8 n=1 Tax=Elsinoe ampelina TaxID=302913 RepID=A0A6A6G4H2_9PEZI|nr:anaphase promoting complex subunit 8 [Elsinoe ampelina]
MAGGLSVSQLRGIERNLQKTVVDCNDRCLYNASKWAAELLNSFPDEFDRDSEDDTDIEDADDETSKDNASRPTDVQEAKLQRRERNKFMMAKSFFDCKEYDRCAVTLLPTLLPQQPINRDPPVPVTPGKGKVKVTASPRPPRTWKPDLPEMSQRSLFLALYARYIAGEKRKEEDSEMILGPSDGPVTANKELSTIAGLLEDYFKQRESEQPIKRKSDGFLEYLYGIVLVKSRNEALAKHWLLRSVTLNEWNWSAWVELGSLISTVEDLAAITPHLSPGLPSFIFQIYISQELYQTSAALYNRLDTLLNLFPTSAFLLTQRALLHYHAKDFDTASHIFSSLLTTHPYRLDSMEIYSNILYVLPTSRPRLSHLATLASSTDRFRPETCVIIGNHYSKSSEHEKAVIYFRRALALDRTFLSAWTLMGHEYIELKNTQAAIESYRRAVDANRKDYRAWHGLGLGYELMDMHSYALYYYNKAAALQPWDPKMWAAVGYSYERCGKAENAIRAFKRALGAASMLDSPNAGGAGQGASFNTNSSGETDPLAACVGGRLDPDVLHQIALLYEGLDEVGEAAAYMELCLAQEEGAEEDEGVGAGTGAGAGLGVTLTTSKARLWLAKWAFSRAEWKRCVELANELCQDGFEVEEAKGLIRDVRGRMGAEGGEESFLG